MPPGWKRSFISKLVGAAAPASLAFARPGLIRVLNYHRINYRSPTFLLDGDAISATPELFERQVAFSKKHFDVISFADLEDAFAGRRRLPARPLLFTFDDGYEDNYREAYAILRHHGVPAMFFLAADYIGTCRLFWWDEVALALNVYEAKRLEVRIGGATHVLDLDTREARMNSTRAVLRLLKTIPNADRMRVLQELGAATHIDRHRQQLPRQTMTWTEALDMANHGMEIGSHSLSHPILSQVLDDAALEDEIAGSKKVLEDKLLRPVSVFSYPVGGRQAVNARVKQAVVNAGYSFAVTYVNGLNRLAPETDRHLLNRLHVDGLTEPEFRMRLVAPQL